MPNRQIFWAEYRNLLFKILFEIGLNIVFDIENPILTFKIGPNIVFYHLKSYLKSGRISYFGIENSILTFVIWPNIVF